MAEGDKPPSHDPEYIKALYLVNLSQFISWENSEDALKICVVGDDALGAKLVQITENSGLSGALNIQSKNLSSTFDSCNILYISETAEFEMQQILYKTSSHRSIVTVSDVKDFIYQKGTIGFVSIDNTIKIEINNSLLKEKGIFVNSELLEIARRVL